MENNSDLHRNRELFGASNTRFHILAQATDEHEEPAAAMVKDIPSTSRQPPMHILNPTFTSHQETITRNGIRRKSRNKAVFTKPQVKEMATSMNPFQNPFPSSVHTISAKDVNSTPNANRNPTPFVTSQAAPDHQQVSHIATTLDPTKHTVVFCSPQTVHPRKGKDAFIEHRARQGLDPQHTSDPPDDRNIACDNVVEKTYTHLEQFMSGAEEAGMSEEEESMSNVRKLARKKPDPSCGVCHGTGRVDCYNCSGEGEWPKWCKICGGGGLIYCSRCLGTGGYRYPMGFHFVKKSDSDSDGIKQHHN
ncbi:hypothetical protein WN944_017845 [Citrus x changshan-huyou]|uniref:Uncharacterized protein n=1 Tax=Citrus x changshan-huyou TaxID=2935761 RepID=A0AAP0MEH8_9ROSI